MALSLKVQRILVRALKGLGAVVVGFAVAWIAGPDVAELVGTETQALIVAVVTPLLLAAEKWLKWEDAPAPTDPVA